MSRGTLLSLIGLCLMAACKQSGGSSTTDAACSDGDGCGLGPDTRGSDAARQDVASTTPDSPASPLFSLCPSSGLITESAGPLPNGVHVVSGATNELAYYAFAGDTAMYWATQDGAIHRVSLSDGSDKLLLDRTSLRNNMQGLAVDDEGLYFLESGSNNPLGVAKMALDGSGSPTSLATARSLWDIGVGGGYVYYFDYNQQAIMRVPTKGGAATPLLRNVDPLGMWIAKGYVYFMHPHANVSTYHILRVSVDNVAPDNPAADGGVAVATPGVPVGAEELATTQWSTIAPVTDDTNVYWADDGNLMYAPLAGGAAQVLATADSTSQFGSNDIDSVVPAGGSIYWSATNMFDSCHRLYVSTAVSPKSTLVQYLGGYPAAATSAYLYILSGEILRMPR